MKDGIYTVYVSEKHRKIENKLNALNTLINDGHITGVSSGSDLINMWISEKFNEMIEKVLAKKVKAPIEAEALTVSQLHMGDEDLKRLLVSKYIVIAPLPHLDDYHHWKIGGKSPTEALKAGFISKETAIEIFASATEAYFDMVNSTDVRNIVKSKNDTRKKVKVDRLKNQLRKQLPEPPTQTTTNAPPALQYNPEDYEEILEPDEISITDPFYNPCLVHEKINKK